MRLKALRVFFMLSLYPPTQSNEKNERTQWISEIIFSLDVIGIYVETPPEWVVLRESIDWNECEVVGATVKLKKKTSEFSLCFHLKIYLGLNSSAGFWIVSLRNLPQTIIGILRSFRWILEYANAISIFQRV